MSPPSSNNNSILSTQLSSNDNYIMSQPSTSKNVEREDEDTGNSETDSNKTKRDRWTAKQTEVLITMWKENYKELKSSKQHKIDGLGSPKTLKQIKTKLRNMKDAYKVSKDNNKKTGRSSSFCAHFDDFYEILGTRDFVNPPFATQVGLNEHGKDNADDQTAAGNKDNDEPEDDTPSEMDDDTLNSTLARKGKKRQKHFLHEDLIILQQEQMEAQREQEERNRMFFIRLWKTKSLRSFAFERFTLLFACCALRISLSFRKT